MRPMFSFYMTAFLVIFCSCNRYYYKPNAVNVPLFTEGGQVHTSLSGSFGTANKDYKGNTYFFDAQFAVSPINHLAIITNYSTYAYRTAKPDFAIGNVDANAHLLEGGIGGYYAQGNKFKMVVDGYVGYGEGRMNSDVAMKFRRFFVQPGIGVRSAAFDASFNLRISNVRYFDFDAKGRDDGYLQDQNLIDAVSRRIDNKRYTFFEPAFTIRTGYKFAKVQLQMVLAHDLTPQLWQYNAVRFSAGVYFSIEEALEKANGHTH
jgi:hypothetical protein